MQFDPDAFADGMGELILKAVEPLKAEIAELRRQLEHRPAPAAGKDGRDGVDGKSVTINEVKPLLDEALTAIGNDARAAVDAAIKALPVPKDGRDGADGKDGRDGRDGKDGKDGRDGVDGKSVTIDEVKPLLDEALTAIGNDARAAVDAAIKALPVPKDGRDGADGKDGRDGKDGERGEKGADGVGMAGAMIDRNGALQISMTNGEVKDLGVVVGKDGRDGIDGKDGRDGISLDLFELEYLDETHEVRVKAGCAGRTKEIRYPAGGIRPAGYWRDGSKAQAGDAWVHDGSLWIAKTATAAKPDARSGDWIIAARRGRDGERGQKGQDGTPPVPIRLKD